MPTPGRPDPRRSRGSHARPAERPAEPPACYARLPRPRTIRARVVALLLVPVVTLLALWGADVVDSVRDDWTLRQLNALDAAVRGPVGGVITALQAERTAAGRYLAAPDPARAGALARQGKATDAAAAALRVGAVAAASERDAAPAAVGETDTLVTAVNGLDALRAKVGARTLGWAAAITAYDGVVDDALAAEQTLASAQDARYGTDQRAAARLDRFRDMLARQDTALASAETAGVMTVDQYVEYVGAGYTGQDLAASAEPDLPAASQAAYRHVIGGSDYRLLDETRGAVRQAGPGAAAVQTAVAGQWDSAAAAVSRQLAQVAAGADAATTAPSGGLPGSGTGVTLVLGLLAVLASLAVSVVVGRGLVRDISALRDAARELAARRLPRAIDRLRAGETLNVEAEAPVGDASDDEIGQVAGALTAVQRTALRAAAERATVLNGVSAIYLNLARRGQVLAHRQLTLLDSMERRTDDPSTLEDLFRVDHLATRMRRHAEGLVILSGAPPGRAWRKPVSLLDVVRSAISEIEEYPRVTVRRMPRVGVAGAAVADLIHLVAELLENATAFAPPHTRVDVTAERVGAGCALEIEDRGLGMSDDALADANRRVNRPDGLDLINGDRLGLFVAGRLARRHGVRISLRRSAYGGVTAVVVIPMALLDVSGSDGPDIRELPAAAGEPAPKLEPVGAPGTAPAAAEATGATGAIEVSGVTGVGLPRRPVRKRPAVRPAEGPSVEPASPDAARATMAAFQQGWRRGRAEADPDADPDDPDDPDEPADPDDPDGEPR